MLNFCFLTLKRHILARNRVVWGVMRENRFGALAVKHWKNPKKKPSKQFWCATSRIRGKETHWGIVTNICMLVDIQDIIMYATFGDDWLISGMGVASEISNFTFPHWLASSLLQHWHYRASAWCPICVFRFRSAFISNDWLVLLRRPAISKLHCENGLNVILRYWNYKQVFGKWHDTPAYLIRSPVLWHHQPQQHLSHISRTLSLLYQHC